MTRLRLLTSCCAVLLLAGCLDDGGELVARVEKTESARTTYAAQALKNYAMMNATGQGALGVTQEGANGLRSMTCAKYDGKGGGVFFAWQDDSGIDKTDYDGRALGSVTAGLVRELGASFVGQWAGGGLVQYGGAVSLPHDCALPELRDGAAVVMVPVKIPESAFAPGFKEEKQARACPEGEEGAAIYMRSVEYTADGRRIEGAWELDELAGCADAERIDLAVAEETGPARSTGNGSEAELVLAASLPDECRRVTLTHRKGRATVGSKSFDTCDFAEVTTAAAAPEPVGVPKEPKAHPPVAVTPPCPSSPVVLPSLSSVAEYTAALAPWLEVLGDMPTSCGVLQITSEAHWPFYQSFLGYGIIEAYCPVSGTYRRDGRGPAYRCTPGELVDRYFGWSEFTRLYRVKLYLHFEGSAGDAAFREEHRAPTFNDTYNTYTTWTNYQALPPAFKSGAQQWLFASSDATSYNVSSMDGRDYPDFVGSDTAAASGQLRGRFVAVPYRNAAGNSWGNDATQQRYFTGISYEAFQEPDFLHEASGTLR